MKEISHLFSAVSIGALRLPCRLVMPPMATNHATTEGFVTDRQIEYYRTRASGGVGYVTVEHTGILDQGKASPFMLMISSDAHMESIKGLVDAVHKAGNRIVVQINHAGRQTASSITGHPVVGPSPIPCPLRDETPHELTEPEISHLVKAFGVAADRVKSAGADGVEIHMAHGYLLCSFLSPFSNQRSDRYGGSVEGRARFPLEVLATVRKTVGPNFPVICRLSGDEYVSGGITSEDTTQTARMLAEEGADALHVSACNAASGYLNHPPYYVREGVFVHLAEAVKSVVDIPVITVGRIRTPEMANRIIQEGKADLVSMGRALIADPELPNKAKDGRIGEIRPCISCNMCIKTLREGPMGCAVNPEAGNERRFKLEKVESPKKVWVIGGGPGGLKAAEVAARRGHDVKLFEQSNRFGGRMRLAAVPPEKGVIDQFLDHLQQTVKNLDVILEIGTRFTLDVIGSEKPDVFIVATGAEPAPPDFPCEEGCHYLTVDQILQADLEQLGSKMMVIGGGGVGAEIADYLSDNRKDVVLVEMAGDVAGDLVGHLKHYLTLRLREKGVEILTSTKIKELRLDYVQVEDESGERRLEGFDAVVIAIGSKSVDHVAKELEAAGQTVVVIGDAKEARGLLEALLEAEEAAIQI